MHRTVCLYMAKEKPVIKRKLKGEVISDKMEKTVVVRVDRFKLHPTYQKRFKVSKKYQAHDPKNQFKIGSLPEKVYIPSILMVVPIVCLFGISLYKFNTYIKNTFQSDLSALSYFSVIISFLFTGIYILIVLYLTKDYFLKEFVKSEFYPSQWGIVCAFVGFEVLGMYVYGNYYHALWIYLLSYIAILIATAIYFVILSRYLQVKSYSE